MRDVLGSARSWVRGNFYQVAFVIEEYISPHKNNPFIAWIQYV
jgi:hypothetical protein